MLADVWDDDRSHVHRRPRTMNVTNGALSAIAEKLAEGARLSADDAARLTATRDLLALGSLADEVRRRFHGDRVTFVRVAPVDAHVGAEVIVPSGAGETRIVGRPASADAALQRVKAVVAAAAAVPVTGFALGDLAACCDDDPAALADLVAALRDAGLALIAEHEVDGRPACARALEAARRGGLEVACLTMPAAPATSRLEVVQQVASLGSAARGVRAFAPLPRTAGSEPSTGYDDVRQVALARLLVDNVASIQVDWSLYGPKLAQVALTFGADDLDGVSAVDTLELGARRAALEEIRRNVRAARLVPVQRNGRFEALER